MSNPEASSPQPPADDWLSPFDFELSDALIAREPAEPRGTSRLLVHDLDTAVATATSFDRLIEFLRPGDLLVVNETRVLPARLKSRLARTGRSVEILLAHPEYGDAGPWWAMLGPSRRLREGDILELEEAEGAFRILEGTENRLRRIEPVDGTAMEWMERAGHLPIPPYLRREDREEDRTWYQTVFAATPGAIAAPTAGLHFTPEHLTALEAAGIRRTSVILHVGPGTFLPVRAESAEEHRVLSERYVVSARSQALIRKTKAEGGRVVAVGTTAVRALETWASCDPGKPGEPGRPAADAAVESVSAPVGPQSDASGWTDLTILPGYSYQVVDALLTNFHLPRSSLLLLVAALTGTDELMATYRQAVQEEFRFYSYGDAMLIVNAAKDRNGAEV